ncbi:serine hydroxymethyltransferase [Candidatus Woesearchaeota archaeon CG08_land_8_20_14_0_20_47_9]|nr:MAG: serine hydroxymethyltransferase [Candidatus Woesearchaeota archaeon CG08_land_8_20_14_0_20_47_9]
MSKQPFEQKDQVDEEASRIIALEAKRQEECINLIASENFASKAVLRALGSVFTNKYSEGYPGKRYYAGNQFVDEVESLAIKRAKELFGAEHVNVQPYSGSPGNAEIYYALLQPGDKVMALDLAQGGHLTHGSPVNFSGRTYNFIHYGVDRKTERIDYEKLRETALREKPKMIVSGFTAYPREVDFKGFAEIAREAGAISMADISHIAGLIVGGVHQSPFPYTDVVMTTTHKSLRGPRGAMIMCKQEFAERIDKAVFPGMQGGPHDNVIAAKAVAFYEAMQPAFKEYARQIVRNANALAEELKENGFRLVSGGTDTHLMLVDLTSKNIAGKPAQLALEKANIITNRNRIPYDKRSPFNPSGLRLGTPAMTTRGMKEPEMRKIAGFISRVIANADDDSKLSDIKEEVIELAREFPMYADV